jgi:hypothetical protein
MIKNMDSRVLKSIDEGYSFFTNWMSSILEKDPEYDFTSTTQQKFLSWQTMDLLRIDVYSLKSFCQHFLTKYPGYFVSPLRLSGSAVESLFSQYKYNARGKLDAANYSSAHAANLIQQTTSSHDSGKGYRDSELSIATLSLKKKLYGTK